MSAFVNSQTESGWEHRRGFIIALYARKRYNKLTQ